MLGYYHDPAATAAAIDADGWLHTGDLAVRRPDGYYHITGRIKDMVIRGGENIYPREIEEYLFRHPAIEQAAVVGLPDDEYGEIVTAIVVPTSPGALDADTVVAHAREHLVRYKAPRRVEIVDALPRDPMGKVRKRDLRARFT